VKTALTIRRLFAFLVIAGLVLAPVARPVMAEPASQNSMQAVADEAMADEMAGEMPCCPSKAPMPVDCDKCVFMAACTAKCLVGLSVAVFRPFFAASGRIARLQNDSWPDGLGHPPPEHPPRTLV